MGIASNTAAYPHALPGMFNQTVEGGCNTHQYCDRWRQPTRLGMRGKGGWREGGKTISHDEETGLGTKGREEKPTLQMAVRRFKLLIARNPGDGSDGTDTVPHVVRPRRWGASAQSPQGVSSGGGRAGAETVPC